MQNDTMQQPQQLEAEMLAHIGACCLESLTTAWVGYDNPLLPREIAKHGANLATDDAALATSELVIAASAPSANLRHDCVLLVSLPNLVADLCAAKAALAALGERFGILMPFALWNLPANPPAPPSWFAFASDSIHPLASLSLQRAELLDGLDWYSAATHQSAFVLPPYLARALRGIVRN